MKTPLLLNILRLCVILSTASVSVAAASRTQFAGGTGEPNTPYQIAASAQLVALGRDPNLWDKHFVLTCDLDMKRIDPNAMEPIGNSNRPFLGDFDGRHHAIANLYIRRELDMFVGLFGCIGENSTAWDNRASPQGRVRNLRVVDIYVRCDCSAGGLVGMLGSGTIEDCSVTGEVTGGGTISDTGGLVGYALGHISRCVTDMAVCGENDVGGLIGEMVGAEVLHCSSTGSVRGTYRIGGLIGVVQFWDYPRGVYADKPKQINPTGTIRGCRSDCSVAGEQMVGGLAGHVFGDGRIEDCYAWGPATGTIAVGGFIGENWGSCIARCYSTGRVLGGELTGGFMGNRDLRPDANDMSRCPPGQLIIEKVLPNEPIDSENRIAPQWRMMFRPAIMSCFWDTGASGMMRGVGPETDAQGGLNPLTTAQMRTAASFRNFGWDFNTVWTIREGEDYPLLRWEQQLPIAPR